jgi:hypothetical protein
MLLLTGSCTSFTSRNLGHISILSPRIRCKDLDTMWFVSLHCRSHPSAWKCRPSFASSSGEATILRCTQCKGTQYTCFISNILVRRSVTRDEHMLCEHFCRLRHEGLGHLPDEPQALGSICSLCYFASVPSSSLSSGSIRNDIGTDLVTITYQY